MNFGERLKKVLAEIGITEYKLAQLANLNKSTIYSIVTGKSNNPSQKTLEAIAKALDMSVSELLGDENAPRSIKEREASYSVERIDNDTSIGINKKHIDDYSPEDIKLALEIIDLIKKRQSST